MLCELDSDQRLWQKTVREVLAKECPAALVRAVVDDGGDAAPLWQVYADLGWTDLVEPTEAVELAILLEELGRATDPTPYSRWCSATGSSCSAGWVLPGRTTFSSR